MNMQGKVAIVTGGGRDIGRACVMALAAQGAAVAINYFASGDGAQSAVDEIVANGGKAFALKGDMTNDLDVKALINKTVAEFGKIDALIHVTGGIVKRVSFEEMNIEHWDRVMDLNVTSLVRCVHACIPHFSEGSSIVALASQAGRDGGGPGAGAYGASKGAVMTMVRGMAKELGPKGIRANALCPGMIDTDFHNIFTKDEVRRHVASITPLKREGTSEEVANAAVFLASDDAAFITGANIDINGGILFS